MKIRMLLRFRAYDKNNNSIGFCALPFGDYRDSQMTLEDLENEISKSINLIKKCGLEALKYTGPEIPEGVQSFRYRGMKTTKPDNIEDLDHLEFKTTFEFWDDKDKIWRCIVKSIPQLNEYHKIKFKHDIINYRKVWYLEAI
ncbi:hypothetical protein [Peptostreptococcus stomatis]